MFKFRLPLGLTLFLIPILIVSACAPAASVDEPVRSQRPSPTVSPTASPSPAAVQPSRPVSTALPVQASLAARLGVITGQARVIRGGSFQTEVQQAQSAQLQREDQVEIVQRDGQSQQSHSILHFPDVVNVELFANTKLSLAEARQTGEGPAEISLDLADGHMFVYLNGARQIHLTVRTSQASIRALTPGAEFDVCRTEELTCVMVKRGIVEIDTKDGKEIVRAGSAGIVLNNQPLSPVVCAPASKFIAWEERYRLSANAPALREEIAALPQQPCPVGANGFPLNARILYRDEFSSASRGWAQGTIDHFTARYVRISGARYYQVQARGAEERYLSFVPNERDYEDVNIDLKTRTETAGSGDFLYGLVFRRSGDGYYAFVVSPPAEAWYFLKSSANGLELLKYGTAKRMRGLEGQDTLRVETYGSTFLAFINGRFIDWLSDPDYARGEVGLFVQTMDNPDALINFNSIVIWDMPAPALDADQGENCFNALDDDGDGRIDQADPDCQSSEVTVPSPVPTGTPRIVRTPTAPPATDRPNPTATNRPPATQPPIPTLSLPTLIPPLPTLSLPTLVIPLPTISLPLPTISLPLPG